jgi:protein TonB
MTAALAPAYLAGSASHESQDSPKLLGAQTLLTLKRARQNYFAETAAVAVYVAILAGALTYTTKPQPAPAEEPMELVMEAPPPPAVEEPKPPEPEAVQPPPVEEPPPPPAAVEPPVAPVKPPEPPKPVVKPKPKPVAKVAPKVPAKPQPQQAARSSAPAAPARTAPVPAGATASAIANQIHARLMRAAANAYPESQKPRSAHISYRVMIDASGHVTSFSITPSGNAAFDSAAQRLGGRIGTVDAPGHPAALSGSFTFAYQ